MKVNFSFSLSITLAQVYQIVRPNIPKKEFIKLLRAEIHQIGEAFINGSGIDYRYNTWEQMVLSNMIDSGHCELTDYGYSYFEGYS